MKNIFKFAAMALAAVALFAACDNKEGEETEEPVSYSIDGKQWTAAWEAMGVDCVVDFGVTTPGTCYLAYDATELGLPGFATYVAASYTVTPTNETSGVINLTLDGQEAQAQVQYSNLDEDSVKITFEALMIDTEFTLVTTNKALYDGMTGEPIQ